MTKKKTIALIDEKIGNYARHTAASSNVANLMAVIAGAALNKAKVQEIREQLDEVKWRLVDVEKIGGVIGNFQKALDGEIQKALDVEIHALTHNVGTIFSKFNDRLAALESNARRPAKAKGRRS